MSADETTRPTFAQVLQMAIDVARAGLRVSAPAQVTAYDRVRRRVDVQLVVPEAHEGESGERVVVTIPQLLDLQVQFDGSGGYHESYPISVGDTGLVVFCGTSIAPWKVTGQIADPRDDRRHHPADAVFQPGIRPAPTTPTDAPADAWVMTVPIGAQLRLGSASADESAILGDAFRSAFDGLLTALNTAISTGPSGAGAFASAVTAFQNLWTTLLSPTVKLK